MVNYQLYRTNVLLGGQMKYNLILDNTADDIIIKSLYITPISNRVPYILPIDKNLFNNSHMNNIKNFYKSTSGSFYKDFTNPVLTSLYPLLSNYKGETHDSTYEMGCHRINYDTFKKQFEFFCPLWIEQIDTIKNLSFEIQILTDLNQNKPLYKKTIKFTDDKVVKYFDEYIDHIKLNEGCDWILDVNNKCSSITGFSVKHGLNMTLREQYLYDILTNRERPVLEFNNLITNKLHDRKLISKQLFNFNFCFNLEDILSPFLYNSLYRHPLYINIVAQIGGEKLELRDIFSNHEYIEKKSLDSPILSINENNELEVENASTGLNVLDYLKDYKCVDLIDKNKITQSTFHWNRSISSESIFNMYRGFAPVYKNKEQTYSTIPYYSDAVTNLTLSSVQNNVYSYWCNNYKPNTNNYDIVGLKGFMEVLIESIFNEGKYEKLFTRFSSNCVVKNIHYAYTGEEKLQPIDVMILQIPSIDDNVILNEFIGIISVSQNADTKSYEVEFDPNYVKITSFNDNGEATDITNTDKNDNTKYPDCNIEFSDEMVKSIHIKKIKEVTADVLVDYSGLKYKEWIFETREGQNLVNERIIAVYSENSRKIIFLHENNEDSESLMLYRNFTNILKLDESTDAPKLIQDLYKILKTGTSKDVHIRFNSGLKTKFTAGPSLSHSEIKYYESDGVRNSIVRNIGKIKPYFIKDDDFYKNYQYYKKNEKEVDPNFNRYTNTLYAPKYPSIGYYAIGCKPEVYKLKSDDNGNLEFHNFISNKIVELKPEITFNFVEEDLFYLYYSKDNQDENLKNDSDVLQQYIKDRLGEMYSGLLGDKTNDNYKNKLNYIFDRYKTTYTHIDSNNEDHKINYKIQIKLK